MFRRYFRVTSMLLGSALVAAACGGEPAGSAAAEATAERGEAAVTGKRGSACRAMGETLQGTVSEVAQVSRYTYLKLEADGEPVWAAVRRSDVSVGDTVRVAHAHEMKDFRSPSTGKVFPSLFLGYLASVPADTEAGSRSCPYLERKGLIKLSI